MGWKWMENLNAWYNALQVDEIQYVLPWDNLHNYSLQHTILKKKWTKIQIWWYETNFLLKEIAYYGTNLGKHFKVTLQQNTTSQHMISHLVSIFHSTTVH